MEPKMISELERNNKTAMIAHWIEVVVMFIFCIVQLTMGTRTALLLVFDAILGFGPVIAEVICWKKNRETTMIKHLVGYGFAVFYTYTLFLVPIIWYLSLLFL